MSTPLWSPPADIRSRSRIGAYLRWLKRDEADYGTLWEWSVTEPVAFWRSIWDYFEIRADTPPERVLESPAMPGARWFPGATLNYAEHVLRAPGATPGEPIVLARGQTRPPQDLTLHELKDQVARVRVGLRARGVHQGDRVVAYAPNIPETLVLLLATASLGAVFSSCAPEFGVRSVIDRWRQIAPKVLVAVDGYRYGDKPVDRRAEVAEIRAALPSLTHTVTIPYLGDGDHLGDGDGTWADLAAPTDEPLAFDPVPFDHPLYVLYSSGTTGLPKPIVHGHGGILIEHLKMLALHHDLGPGDRFLWFTTTGWMMWNLLVSGPAVGAAIVLFDGSPAHPDLGAMWRLAEETGATYFGTSAPFLMACRKAGLVPRDVADLSRIRGLGSTGAPLPAEGFEWVYENVHRNLRLDSLSGGTDVCTGFVGGSPLLPVRAGTISCRALGASVEAFDPDGKPVRDRLGELVITAPMPSMPVGFWGDEDGSRYREAYFDVFPGVWRHGDWITIDPAGGCVITGRSDATLNRGGVRLGTAEFYSVVESLDEVADSLVVHLEETDELLLFVVPAKALDLEKIARALRTGLSPRHVPDEIHPIGAVPRTLSGKKLEVPVKRILGGTPAVEAAAKGALANPESLAAFEQLAARRATQG
jgi:acetoacetyl-CoA synthetase